MQLSADDISVSHRLSRLIFFGEHSLRRVLTAYIDHFHRERNQRMTVKTTDSSLSRANGAQISYVAVGDSCGVEPGAAQLNLTWSIC